MIIVKFPPLHRNVKFLSSTAGEFTRNFNTVLHSYTLNIISLYQNYSNRNERTDITSTHSRMSSMLLSHINEFISNTAGSKSTFNNTLLVTNESINSSVGRLTSINVKNGATS